MGEMMAEKVCRDLSTPENRAWWAGVDKAAKRVTKLVPGKPKAGDQRFVWKPETEKTTPAERK